MKRFFMYLYALINCLYIFTIGYIFKKNRKFISNLCELFDYQKVRERIDPGLKTIIPEIEIAAITDDSIPIQLHELPWVDGNISLLELTVIIKLLKKFHPDRIFEVGTFDGRTTLNLACNSSQKAVVYTLDIPDQSKISMKPSPLSKDFSFVDKVSTGSRFRETECGKKITQLFGDSAAFNFSPYDDTIDFVFVDGAHTYDYALNDSEKAMKLLRNGRGIIIWHDYSWVWAGVTKALNKLYKTDSRFGSIRHIRGTSLVCYINTDLQDMIKGINEIY